MRFEHGHEVYVLFEGVFALDSTVDDAHSDWVTVRTSTGARIELPIGQKHSAVVVPEAALVADQGRKLVYVVKDAVDDKTGEVVKNDKGKPLRETFARYVEIGSYQNGMRVITSNLDAGEIVVVSGLQRVRDKLIVREKAVEPPKVAAPNVTATVTNERGGAK